MGTEQATENPPRANCLLYKVTGDQDRVAYPWPAKWKIPANALVGLGLSHTTAPLVIAFSPKGRLRSHASLESAIASIAPDRLFIPAFLKRTTEGRRLEIIVPPEESPMAKESPDPENPIQVLTETALATACQALHVEDYYFLDRIPHQTKAEAMSIPKDHGIKTLVWHFKNRSGD